MRANRSETLRLRGNGKVAANGSVPIVIRHAVAKHGVRFTDTKDKEAGEFAKRDGATTSYTKFSQEIKLGWAYRGG